MTLKAFCDVGFEFVEIFVIENILPAIKETGSRRLRGSVIQRVADSPNRLD